MLISISVAAHCLKSITQDMKAEKVERNKMMMSWPHSIGLTAATTSQLILNPLYSKQRTELTSKGKCFINLF
jgi:hypothetical protein